MTEKCMNVIKSPLMQIIWPIIIITIILLAAYFLVVKKSDGDYKKKIIKYFFEHKLIVIIFIIFPFILYIALLLIWLMPFLEVGSPEGWLSFLGGYIGLGGALSIGAITLKEQKKQFDDSSKGEKCRFERQLQAQKEQFDTQFQEQKKQSDESLKQQKEQFEASFEIQRKQIEIQENQFKENIKESLELQRIGFLKNDRDRKLGPLKTFKSHFEILLDENGNNKVEQSLNRIYNFFFLEKLTTEINKFMLSQSQLDILKSERNKISDCDIGEELLIIISIIDDIELIGKGIIKDSLCINLDFNDLIVKSKVQPELEKGFKKIISILSVNSNNYRNGVPKSKEEKNEFIKQINIMLDDMGKRLLPIIYDKLKRQEAEKFVYDTLKMVQKN